MLTLTNSAAAFAAAKQLFPGGVNSPVRSFGSVGGTPPFIARADGSRIFDIDGNEYIDYVGSWGPMIFGHAPKEVVDAVTEAAKNGTSYGAPTLLESRLAALIQKAYPSMEMMRMVNSGTEATMSALRLARGYTGRNKIVKFIGCYHGHSDSLLVSAGSGAATFGMPSSPGVTKNTAADTIAVPYNDVAAIEEVFAKWGEDVAAVIVEPVAGNMGLVLPKDGYLQKLRDLTAKNGTVLIFDEVMCGFRVAVGGAQEAYGITPDLTCLGKVVGGGLPCAVYGGRREIMECVSPAGKVYQAGTLSGNPIAMAAGIAVLTKLIGNADGVDYARKLQRQTEKLVGGLKELADAVGIPVQAHKAGSMFCLFFAAHKVENYDDVSACDFALFTKYFRGMLAEGIYLAPSQYETLFMSAAHTDGDIDRTLTAAKKVFESL